MKKITRTFLSLLLVMALITVSSSNVFATEVSDSVISSEAIETASTGSGSFTNSATVQFIFDVDIRGSTSKVMPKATFSINGYSNTEYKVEIISPIGTSYVTYIKGDGSSHSHKFSTIVPGTYYFHVWPWNGTSGKTCTFTCSLT